MCERFTNVFLIDFLKNRLARASFDKLWLIEYVSCLFCWLRNAKVNLLITDASAFRLQLAENPIRRNFYNPAKGKVNLT